MLKTTRAAKEELPQRELSPILRPFLQGIGPHEGGKFMDKKDSLNALQREMEKVAAMKKALVLYKLLKEAEANREQGQEKDLKVLRQKLMQIQISLGMTEDVFYKSLYQLSHKIQQQSAQVIGGQYNNLGAHEVVSTGENGATEGEEGEEMSDWEVNFRKRYCVNKSCRYNFSVGRPFTKNFSRRCLKCGAATLFVIHS